MFRLCWIILTWSFTLTVQIDLGDELLKNMVTTTESPSTSEFQCANGFRIPWLLTCEGTNHCTDGSDEDPAMCLPRTCPMGFPYKCVASGRCLSELWLCDGQKDCPDGADENQIACKLDPLLLLQQIMRKMKSHEELREHFDFELSPIPLTLFDKRGRMRKMRKPKLYIFFPSVINNYTIIHRNVSVVIDGGFILHRVEWPSDLNCRSISESYVTYVTRRYGTNCTIIFDGYIDDINSIKSAERLHYRQRNQDENVNKKNDRFFEFLSNIQIKNRIIKMLTKKFQKYGIRVIQAEDDPDLVIVHTARQYARNGQPVVVVGNDVNLFVLLFTLSGPNDKIVFVKYGKGNRKTKSYDIPYLRKKLEYLVPHLLFVHAIGGCDATSTIMYKGKLKHIMTFQNHPEIHDSLLIFNNPSASHEDILRAGENFLLKLYGAPDHTTSLNSHRFDVFSALIWQKKRIDINLLPPTLEAAKQHIFRTYLQVQLWRGNHLNPLDWGWKRDKNNVLRPVFTQKPPAQDSLLKFITFACTKMCEQNSGRKKTGMKFAIVCEHCQQQSRLNQSLLIGDGENFKDIPDAN